MFTGLIQTTGTVARLDRSGTESRISIVPAKAFKELSQGESIAVNGVCLTVEDFSRDRFSVYASRQTMGITNLGGLKTGSMVNLERALRLGDRLGGHLVSGHVDCLAKVSVVEKAGQSVIYTVSFPEQYTRQVIDKGSVTLDGISLTVIDCGPDFLKVNVIPATRNETNVAGWKNGSLLNMETDLIGKYVEKMLGPRLDRPDSQKHESPVTEDFLRRHGF